MKLIYRIPGTPDLDPDPSGKFLEAVVDWVKDIPERQEASPEQVWDAIGFAFGFVGDPGPDGLVHPETDPALVRDAGTSEAQIALNQAKQRGRINGNTQRQRYWQRS